MSTATPDERLDRGPVPVTPLRRWEWEPAPLPAPLTPFLGRDAEVAAVCDLLRREPPRLVTLTGPGGVGKTRLALRIAEEVAAPSTGSGQAFPDGVVYVGLAPVRSPVAVVATIAKQLGLRETGDRPLADPLRTFLRGQTLLLVLDNFEHVLAATPVVVDLLTGCRRLKILVTSRTRLRVLGEHAFPVPPLGLPDRGGDLPIDRLGQVPAVRLFVERAQAVDPRFALTEGNVADVAEICRRVDGLPLAVELAAARVAVLPPAALLARLESRLAVLVGGPRDLPARQRTMRDAIAWSYDLLDPPERALFRYPSVFVGGFTLDAATAVARTDVVAGLEVLLGASLLQRNDEPGADASPDGARYAMLETVREFALEQLAGPGGYPGEDHEVRRRHAAWCAATAALLGRGMDEPGFAASWPRFAAERGNLSAGLAWLESQGAHEELLRLAALLWPFWYHDSHLAEGRRWLSRALAAAGSEPTRLRARALAGAAMLAHFHGDNDAAEALCEEALAGGRQLADDESVALACYARGLVNEGTGRYAAAEPLFLEALAGFEAIGNAFWANVSRVQLGIVAHGRNDLPSARAWVESGLAGHRAAGHRWAMGHALLHPGQIALAGGDTPAARAALAEAHALMVERGAPRSIALDIIATIAAYGEAIGQPATAVRLLAWAEAGRELSGLVSRLPARSLFERAETRARTTLGSEVFATASEAGRALSPADAFAAADALLAAPDAPTAGGVAPTAVARDRGADAGLTPRQVQVLRLLARHLTDKEIAAELSLSPRTVMHHVSSVLGKLGVATRREAAAWAARHGSD